MRLLSSLLLTTTLFFVQAIYADTVVQPYPLNVVNLQLTAEQWVSTQTANVVVNIDANLDKAGLAEAHKQIIENLAKIAKDANWHITNFQRNKDQSGLETLHVEAKARLPENQLANLRDKAKAVTQPAARYSISNIDFTPGFAEIEQTKAALRAQIYAAAKAELANLNKQYPEQHYFLHAINFEINGMRVPVMRNMVMATATTEASGFSTSNKLTMSAAVVFASTQNVQTLTIK